MKSKGGMGDITDIHWGSSGSSGRRKCGENDENVEELLWLPGMGWNYCSNCWMASDCFHLSSFICCCSSYSLGLSHGPLLPSSHPPHLFLLLMVYKPLKISHPLLNGLHTSGYTMNVLVNCIVPLSLAGLPPLRGWRRIGGKQSQGNFGCGGRPSYLKVVWLLIIWLGLGVAHSQLRFQWVLGHLGSFPHL